MESSTKTWLNDIKAARRRDKNWRKDGQRVLDIYHGAKPQNVPFNILYSNTETLLPALYGNPPRPLVQRRFKDADPMGKASALAGQRMLEYMVDTNSREYDPFNQVLEDAVLDALLPGRGVSIVKYDPETGDAPGSSNDSPATPVVLWETVCAKSVEWNRIVFGYTKKWSQLPWLAIEHDVDEAEATELFGKAKAAKLAYVAGEQETDEDGRPKTTADKEDEKKTAKIWEIWDKDGGQQVRFLAADSPQATDWLKVDDDPLGITGFFPVPEPLRFLKKSNNQTATAPYVLYENQAKELNRITLRINKIVEACKVRGIYSPMLVELETLFKQDDNKMIPAEDAANMDEKGLDKHIWIYPIEKLTAVLQQLYIAREACKQVIYEITGISDILRGASKASETLGAQEIKKEFGTLRLKRMQREVQRYARDMLRIMLEIGAKKFLQRTMAQMTGLQYSSDEQVAAAQEQVKAAMTIQQPPPPEAQQVLSQPPWSKVMELLKSDPERQYRIDIETNSTVDLDATEDKKDMGELLAAVGTFVQGVAPLIQSGAMPFQVAQSMLLSIVRRFRFGQEVEDMVMQMQQPKNPDEGKAEAEKQKMAMEMEQSKQTNAMELEKARQENELQAQSDQRKAELEREVAQMEMEFKREEHRLRMAELQGKLAVTRITSQVKLEEAHTKHAIAIDAKKRGLNEPAGGAGKAKEKA